MAFAVPIFSEGFGKYYSGKYHNVSEIGLMHCLLYLFCGKYIARKLKFSFSKYFSPLCWVENIHHSTWLEVIIFHMVPIDLPYPKGKKICHQRRYYLRVRIMGNWNAPLKMFLSHCAELRTSIIRLGWRTSYSTWCPSICLPKGQENLPPEAVIFACMNNG